MQPGIDFNREKATGQRILGEPEINDYAFFVSSEITALPKLSIRPGVRFVYNSKYEAPPAIPSLNLKYNINEELYYVDLPGYGFAKVTQSVKEKWGHMIENYLQTSKQLKMVFLLIDIRHKPSKNDVMMYDWILHNGYRPVIIATKLDKLKRSQVPKHLKEIRTELQMDKETPIFPFSALSKQGRDEIWDFIESMVLQQEEAE